MAENENLNSAAKVKKNKFYTQQKDIDSDVFYFIL